MSELMLICASWCVCIYGLTEGIKSGLKAGKVDRAIYHRFVPLIPICVGIASGFAMGPYIWQHVGIEVHAVSGAILSGAGAGSSSAWVYGLVKHTITSDHE